LNDQDRMQRARDRAKAENAATQAEIDQLRAYKAEWEAKENAKAKERTIEGVVAEFEEAGLRRQDALLWLATTPGDFSLNDLDAAIRAAVKENAE
jgi:hypothetical protein